MERCYLCGDIVKKYEFVYVKHPHKKGNVAICAYCVARLVVESDKKKD